MMYFFIILQTFQLILLFGIISLVGNQQKEIARLNNTIDNQKFLIEKLKGGNKC